MKRLSTTFIYLLLSSTLLANSEVTLMQEEESYSVDILNPPSANSQFLEISPSLNQTLELPPLRTSLKITIDDLKQKQKGAVRNFYIWQFLQQDITPTQADEALVLVEHMDMKLFSEYAKKRQHDETYAIIECQNATATSLVGQSSDCIAVGLTFDKAVTLDFMQKQSIIEKLSSTYKNKAEMITILNSPLPFTKLVSTSSTNFFELFNNIDKEQIKRYFNYKLSLTFLNRVAQFDEFKKTIEIIVTTNGLENLQKSFLGNFDYTKLDNQSLFYLGLNAIKFEDKQLSANIFTTLKEKVSTKKELDRVNFWLYKATSNEKFLQELKASNDLNLYSIFVKENKQNTKFPPLTKEILDNYPTLYGQFLKDESLQNQALIYSIAKQNSNLNPQNITNEFGLGLLGLNLAQIEQISKAVKQELNFEEQLQPQKSIEFALFRLKELEKVSSDIPFLIYAYEKNQKFAQDIILLKSQKEYEPFLNMELSTSKETSKFFKEVLLNYYFYINKLDSKNPTKLTTIFSQTVANSSQIPSVQASTLSHK